MDRLGADLCLTEDWMVLASPGNGYWEDAGSPGADLVLPLSTEPILGAGEHIMLITNDVVAGGGRLGEQIVCPGAITASGEATVLALTAKPDLLDYDAWLFDGPLTRTQIAQDDAIPVPWSDLVRGAACGDLDADGTDDLCLNTGIAFGPLADPIVAEVTWSAVTTPREIRVTAADLDDDGLRELIVTEPDVGLVHRLESVPTGDLDLAATAASTWTAPGMPTVVLADGDLDGDGLDDLVVAWDTALAVATDVSGSDLSTAPTTVSLTSVQDVAVGDVDGDGADDLIVGTQGEVRIYLGPLASGTLTDADAEKLLVGQQHPDDDFGHALLTADLDGDGDDELVVGAPEHLRYDQQEGRVYRYMNPVLAP